MDDYVTKYAPIAKMSPSIVTREENDYPSLDIRQKILDRLSGIFNGIPSAQSNLESLYVLALDAPEGWKQNAAGGENTSVEIDAAKKQITFQFPAHKLVNAFDAGIFLNIADTTTRLKAQFSDDAKSITLTNTINSQIVYTCANNNFLKLICSDHGITVSVSEDQTQPGRRLSYRFSHLEPDSAGHYFMEYKYGTLTEANSP